MGTKETARRRIFSCSAGTIVHTVAHSGERNKNMADPAVEWQLLMNRLGFNDDTTLGMANNGIFGLDTIIEFTKEDLKTTLEHVMKYPHPAQPQGSVVYISATAKYQNIYVVLATMQ
jgi:hypothetical protein